MVHLHSGKMQRMTYQVNIGLGVDSSGKGDSLLLAARKVDPLFSNFSGVT